MEEVCINKETQIQDLNNPVEKPKKKRGRKPGKSKNIYFGEEEEQAFIDYVQSDNKRFRDKIFAQKLYQPFTKMIESIIRRYNLFAPDEDFEETFHDTMSFLITKLNNFDPSKNYKAYSYCGTICKNYLILKRVNYVKKIKKEISYEMTFPNTESDRRINSDTQKKEMLFNMDLIENTISQLQEILMSENTKTLTDNEIKIGNALLEMMMNWEDIFKYMGSQKFNKSCVLQFIRDYTYLSTKEIREGMKRYKELYLFTKEKLLVE